MLSLNSLPFLVETSFDTTLLLLHTRNLKFTPKFTTLNASSLAFSNKGLGGCGRLNYGSVRLVHKKNIRAVGKSFETGDDESEDDVVKVTIENSKKVIALQRELLKQVLLLWNLILQKGF